MMFLATTTDKFQLVTSAAVNTDVHATYMDYSGGTATTGRQNTAITTATTTDIVNVPGASTTRNVKYISIRNKGASSQTVTVLFDQNGTDYEVISVALQPGSTLQYTDTGGWSVVNLPTADLYTANTTDTVANAADTYLAGSALLIGGRIKAGTILNWKFKMSKTAAGVATPVYSVRFGTAGTTGDTARCTLTGVAQTAATDNGWHEIECIVRSVSATSTAHAAMTMEHVNTTTGLANAAQIQILSSLSASFDNTAAGLIAGVSCNPGASGVWTFQNVIARAVGLL